MATAIFVSVFAATGATAALKGRWLLFLVGLLLGPAVWAISFLVPATPRSWWFAHLYGNVKRERAVSAAERVEVFRRR
jgi:hypothetical protein